MHTRTTRISLKIRSVTFCFINISIFHSQYCSEFLLAVEMNSVKKRNNGYVKQIFLLVSIPCRLWLAHPLLCPFSVAKAHTNSWHWIKVLHFKRLLKIIRIIKILHFKIQISCYAVGVADYLKHKSAH